MPKIPDEIYAIIFDLDGVITQTAQLHAQAWKRLFDEFFIYRRKTYGDELRDFDMNQDYRRYVDGKSRLDGIKSVLDAWNIRLSTSAPCQSSALAPCQKSRESFESIEGLGTLKNQYFLQLLNEHGASVYDDTVEKIRELRRHHLKVGVISASKNCKRILEKCDLTQMFDVIVDGQMAAENDLRGKPEPDIFLKAAQELRIAPRNILVIEDAISGIEAAKKGHFGLVYWIVRRQNDNKRKENYGADAIIMSTDELMLPDYVQSSPRHAFAESNKSDILRSIGKNKPIIFLDYDGTLTPIVSHPDKAILSDSMRALLDKLHRKLSVAIVSGRDLQDVREKVNVDGLFYAGSHGFDILTADGRNIENPKAENCRSAITKAADDLKELANNLPGCLVEEKHYSVAIHYRNASAKAETQILTRLNQITHNLPELRVLEGKKVFELQPKITWDKGIAIKEILPLITNEHEHSVPIYIGDDVTDEDAFLAIRELGGISFRVGTEHPPSLANYYLDGPNEVHRLLKELLEES